MFTKSDLRGLPIRVQIWEIVKILLMFTLMIIAALGLARTIDYFRNIEQAHITEVVLNKWHVSEPGEVYLKECEENQGCLKSAGRWSDNKPTHYLEIVWFVDGDHCPSEIVVKHKKYSCSWNKVVTEVEWRRLEKGDILSQFDL